MTTTARRIQYALGYLALGLTREAAEELDAIAVEDHHRRDVMAARIEVHSEAGQWDRVCHYARRILLEDESSVAAWIALGCAVRRIEGIAAARDLLLRVEPVHGGEHAIIHYNLACYHCLLGEREAAEACLRKACGMDGHFKSVALADPDLATMRPMIAELD